MQKSVTTGLRGPRVIRTWTGGCAGLLTVVLTIWGQAAAATEPPPASVPTQVAQPRLPWTSSRITGSPQPPAPYATENAFPHLTFDQPVELLAVPGTGRLVVGELGGRIRSFENRSEARQIDHFFDLKAHVPELTHLYGLAFHPRFTENRELFVCYVLPGGRADGSRVSRFRVEETEPPQVDPDSEEILIIWPSGGHNGGSLQFGPDGYLYISTGDAAGPSPPDPLRAGQDVSNLLSAVLRIDVDDAGADRPYTIPPDNPFVDLPSARAEIWAYGFRNPWRMSFDARRGDLWIGDVGWELWEMIYRVEPGGNYGWSIMEGRQPILSDAPRGPTPILPPTVDHPHSEAASITGGYVYWGERLKELQGAYIYGDYETGKVWGLRLDGTGEVAWQQELADTSLRIVSFGIDADHELYVVDHAGSIQRLIPNPEAGRSTSFPRRLSQTGLFASLTDQQPAPGVVPYAINARMWQDGATSRRWIAVPGQNRVQTGRGKWSYPEGTVLVKTLELPVTGGDSVKVETQLLHFDGRDWHAYSYRWRKSQEDADLVPAEGEQAEWHLPQSAADQPPETREWQYASRSDCLRCHNPWSGPPLAFDTAQLDRTVTRDGDSTDQLGWLDAVALTDRANAQRGQANLVDPHDADADLQRRARSYLHVNCAHCHRLHAGGSVPSQMVFDLPLSETQLLDQPPTQGDLTIPNARVIAAGDPSRSVLLHRMAKSGQGRMPRLGARQVDRRGLALVHAWVAQLADGHAERSESRTAEAASHSVELPEWLASASDAEQRGEGAFAEHVRSPADAWQIVMALHLAELNEEDVDSGRKTRVAVAAVSHPNPVIRDLFEPFLPADQRRRRLGDQIRPADILELTGDPTRGEQQFFGSGQLQCAQCHRVGERGKALGPDLSDIGSQRSRDELLESLLHPSGKIEPQYQTHQVQTTDGRVVSGILLKRGAEGMRLRDAQQQEIELRTEEIERMVTSPQSLMPAGLLSELTPQEAADLLAFLGSLRRDRAETNR